MGFFFFFFQQPAPPRQSFLFFFSCSCWPVCQRRQGHGGSGGVCRGGGAGCVSVATTGQGSGDNAIVRNPPQVRPVPCDGAATLAGVGSAAPVSAPPTRAEKGGVPAAFSAPVRRAATAWASLPPQRGGHHRCTLPRCHWCGVDPPARHGRACGCRGGGDSSGEGGIGCTRPPRLPSPAGPRPLLWGAAAAAAAAVLPTVGGTRWGWAHCRGSASGGAGGAEAMATGVRWGRPPSVTHPPRGVRRFPSV